MPNTAVGYLSEGSRTNTIVHSDDLSITGSWVPTLASASLAVGVEGPVIGENVYTLAAEEGDGEHSVAQTGFTGVGVVSVMVKQHPSATQNTFTLGSNSGVNRYVRLDFTTGLATFSGANDGGVVPLGDSWYWLWVRHTGVDAIRLQAGSAAYDQVGSSPEVYIQAPQRESVNDIPTSYIPNRASSGTVTRAGDHLWYVAGDGNFLPLEPFTVDCSALILAAGTVDRSIINFTKNGTTVGADDRVWIYDSVSNVLRVLYSSPTDIHAQITGQAVANGTMKPIRIRHDSGTGTAHINGTTTQETVPEITEINRIEIGARNAGTNQLQGLISAIKIYNTDKGEP